MPKSPAGFSGKLIVVEEPVAITYFGRNVDDVDESTISGFVNYNVPAQIDYVCPDTGSQIIKEMGFRCHDNGGGGNIRIAIYDTSLNLLFEGSAEIAVSGGATPAWYTHTSFLDAAGDPAASPAITGGTSYILAVTADGDIHGHKAAGSSGDHKYIATDYTGGFPDPIAAGTNSATLEDVRCGVEPAPVGGANIVPIIDHHNRMMAMMGS